MLPVLVVVIAVLALAIGAFELKDSVLGTGSTPSSGNAGDEDPGQGAAPTAPTSTSATSSPTTTHTSSPTSTASPSGSATSAPVNHALAFRVLNATSRSGLAARATSKLKAAGWKASNGGNERRFSSPTTVYYGKASLAATAKAIAASLGGYRVHLTSTYGSNAVTVVLGSNYTS
jgi:LytR cell envelope-related transcriptional attenuator